MKISDYVTFDRLKKYLGKQYKDSKELSLFVKDLAENVFLMPDAYKNTTTRAFLICMEDIPITKLNINSAILPNLEDEYSNGLLNLNKELLLEKYYIQVRVGKQEYDDFYSYKGVYDILNNNDTFNIDNLTTEVNRIIEDFETLKNFLNDSFGTISIAEEFLSINNNMPKMLTEDRIVVYSALLNYSRSELENTIYYKNYLEKFINNWDNWDDWDNIRVEFKEFLEELSKRTINY